MDFDQTASRLYGGDQPDATPEATAAPTSRHEQEIADSLYGGEAGPAQRDDIPPAVQALRDTPERRLFDPGKGSTTVGAGALDTEAYGAVDLPEALRVGADLGASGEDMQRLAVLVGQHRAASDETVAEWTAQSMALIGAELSPSDIDLARKLVARDPRLCAFLDATGLGSHPEVVRRFARLGQDARSRGEI